MNPVVELNQVTKHRGDFTLGPIQLALESGMITAVLGPNGSGKTTLFRMMMNLIYPDQGTLRLFGAEVTQERELEVKGKIGFVGDTLVPLDEKMTVGEWKQFVAGWYPSWDEKLWQRLAERLEIQPKKRIKELSTGMHKRVAFALALSFHPELLLLDEPSSGLDPFAWRIMMDEIQTFMQKGDRTAIIATHMMEEVRRLADLIVFMYDGRIVGIYEKDRLLEDWKTMWVRASADVLQGAAGVVFAEAGHDGVTRLITNDAKATEAELRNRNLSLVERKAVELEDILWHLMEIDKKNAVNGVGSNARA